MLNQHNLNYRNFKLACVDLKCNKKYERDNDYIFTDLTDFDIIIKQCIFGVLLLAAYVYFALKL